MNKLNKSIVIRCIPIAFRGLAGLFFLMPALVASQTPDSLSVEWFYQKVDQNYPAALQKEMITEKMDLKNESLNRTLLPSINLNAKATYLSDVTEFNVSNSPIPIDFPKVPNDQYAFNIDVKQPIFQGGIVPIQKKIETSANNEQILSLDSKLLDIKTKLAEVYFSILFTQKQLEIIKLMGNELEDRISVADAAFTNGAMLQSDLDALKAEKIKADQQIMDLQANLRYLFETLSSLSGIHVDTTANLILTDTTFQSVSNFNRPEYDIFNNNIHRLDLSKKALTTTRLPKIYGFAELGYGNPGINMMSGGWDSYYFIGASLSWDLFDWNRTKKEKQILAVNQDIIQNNRENYDISLNIAIDRYLTTIASLQNQIEMDNELVDLYKTIVKSSASQLDHGVITTVDYLAKLNKAIETAIKKEMHSIQLAQSIMNYNLLTGKYYNNETSK